MRETLVDLIRHGEPIGGRRYRGNGRGNGRGVGSGRWGDGGSGSGSDDPLSPLGWSQMRQALGGGAPWHQIVSSPLVRCRGMAAELAGRHGLPLAVEPALREIGMGTWEGRTHEDVQTQEPAVWQRVYADPVRYRPPGGETLEAFRRRVAAAYERQVAAYPGRHLLILCHAGVMRTLVGHLLLADPGRWWRLRIDYAHLVRVRHGPYGPSLECVNAPHLPR